MICNPHSIFFIPTFFGFSFQLLLLMIFGIIFDSNWFWVFFWSFVLKMSRCDTGQVELFQENTCLRMSISMNQQFLICILKSVDHVNMSYRWITYVHFVKMTINLSALCPDSLHLIKNQWPKLVFLLMILTLEFDLGSIFLLILSIECVKSKKLENLRRFDIFDHDWSALMEKNCQLPTF